MDQHSQVKISKKFMNITLNKMRIVIIQRDRCKPKDCDFLCLRVCPMVKTGKETIVKDEEAGKPIIQEDLCSGCGICVKKCPYEALKVINLPEELEEPVHQYGQNGFRLYNLPSPREGVVGILGKNGIGKTTLLKILSSELEPNLGNLEKKVTWQEIIEKFRGKEIQDYLETLSQGSIKAVYKPQFVDLIPKYVKGQVKEILEKRDEKSELNPMVKKLNLKNSLEKEISELSGGELQKVALALTLLKEADVYLIDEPSAYLDVEERLNLARAIREVKKKIFVVEHDLVVLDYLVDYLHILYGSSGAYGIVSYIKGVRVGINEYLQGYLQSERMRFRPKEIKFQLTPKEAKKLQKTLISYHQVKKKYPQFSLEIAAGDFYEKEILGILGPNAIGKTTFVKILAGVTDANKKLDLKLTVSYKPQYIPTPKKVVSSLNLKEKLIKNFHLRPLLEKKIDELSGGELQKVAIANCLSQEAELYLLDEPSAYLDVEERLKLSKYLEKFSHEKEASVLIVDHDLLLIDTLSNRVMAFSGESGKFGQASSPMELRKGLNSFLKKMELTFRRDPETGRPRANKLGSVKDREQKAQGEYYYVE